MSERYPLKTIEKKWRDRWGLKTPLSFAENVANSARIRHFGDTRPLIYADIAQKRGKTCPKTTVLSLFSPVYQDKSGSFVSFDTVFDEKQVKKGKNEPMSEEKKNTVSVELVAASYGIDACRLFLVSDNPPTLPLVYDEDAIEGAWRFINLFWQRSLEILLSSETGATIETAQKQEIENLFDRNEIHKAVAKCRALLKIIRTRVDLKTICTFLFPVIPHITSEILEQLETRSVMPEES